MFIKNIKSAQYEKNAIKGREWVLYFQDNFLSVCALQVGNPPASLPSQFLIASEQAFNNKRRLYDAHTEALEELEQGTQHYATVTSERSDRTYYRPQKLGTWSASMLEPPPSV